MNTINDADIKAASKFSGKKNLDATKEFPTVAVVLSGSGVLDGSDCVEVAALSIQLYNYGIKPLFYAPENAEIGMVYNHLQKTEDPLEERWAFKEASRVVREVHPLSQLNANDHLALLIPGGDGSVMTLSDIFTTHDDLAYGLVNQDADNAIKNFHGAKKPIVACGAASVLVAQVLGTYSNGPGVSVAAEGEFAKWIGLVGSRSENVEDIIIDRENSILSLKGVSSSSHFSFDALFEECGQIVETLSSEFFTSVPNVQRDRYLEVKGNLPSPEKQAGS